MISPLSSSCLKDKRVAISPSWDKLENERLKSSLSAPYFIFYCLSIPFEDCYDDKMIPCSWLKYIRLISSLREEGSRFMS